jgi:predicted PurR-regulated permease PerM
MSDAGEVSSPIRIRPGELASALVPLLLVVWALYVAVELVWACSQLVLLLGSGILVAILVSRIANKLHELTGLPPKFGSFVVVFVVAALLLSFLFVAGAQVVTQFGQLFEEIPATTARFEKEAMRYEIGREALAYIRANSTQMSPAVMFGNVRGIFSSAVGFFTALAFFLFTALYLSVDPKTYRKGFLRMVRPKQRRQRVDEILSALGDQLWHFLLGQMGTMSVLAVMTTVGLWFLEIPSYLALGLIAGGLAFIPLLGPTLAFLPAILIASSQGAAAMLWVAGLYAGIQFLEGNFLTPLIQRKMTSIPPVLLITAQAIMGLLFGVFGVALAAPAAVVVMVMVNELYLNDSGDDSLQERTVAVVEETAL